MDFSNSFELTMLPSAADEVLYPRKKSNENEQGGSEITGHESHGLEIRTAALEFAGRWRGVC